MELKVVVGVHRTYQVLYLVILCSFVTALLRTVVSTTINGTSMVPAGFLIFVVVAVCRLPFAFLLFACHRAVQAVGGVCVGDGAQIQRHQAQQRGSQK